MDEHFELIKYFWFRKSVKVSVFFIWQTEAWTVYVQPSSCKNGGIHKGTTFFFQLRFQKCSWFGKNVSRKKKEMWDSQMFTLTLLITTLKTVCVNYRETKAKEPSMYIWYTISSWNSNSITWRLHRSLRNKDTSPRSVLYEDCINPYDPAESINGWNRLW